jgi:Zn-dependent protease
MRFQGALLESCVIKLLLLLLSGAKLGKLFASGGTMLLSLVVYAFVFGWRYAAGFIALLFAHEMGHFMAARQRGLAVGLPTFIPFVGAWIDLKEQPRDVETEAYVALAGPVVGTVAAILCYVAAGDDGPRWLLAVAYSGFFLNLFNLLPLSPLDGGRITAVLSPRIWLVGVPLLIAFFLWHPNPMLLLIALLAAPQVLKAWRYDPKAPENAVYYAISPRRRYEILAVYFGLAAYLAFMAYRTHELISPAAT